METYDINENVNFGPGIELLMNDRQKKASFSNNVIDIDLGELDNLETELNNLSTSNDKPETDTFASTSKMFGNFFNWGGSSDAPEEINLDKDNIRLEEPMIGRATKETMNSQTSSSTWDGFSKMNEIPIINDKNSSSAYSEREKRRKKRMMIKKLEEWQEKGLIKKVSHFTLDSPFDEIEDEYETALEDKRAKDSIKLQGWWFMTFINSVEYANAAFNPFDINLDGWGEQVSEDIDSYEDIFVELHDKYKGGKLAPEISLLLRIGFSAAIVNFTNKALSTATPGFNDVIRQSPELMKLFTNATVSSMNQTSPSFGFMNQFMGGGGGKNDDGINTSFGPPPPPVETRTDSSNKRNVSTAPPNNRPDIQMARGVSNLDKSYEINQSYQKYNEQPMSSVLGSSRPLPPPNTSFSPPVDVNFKMNITQQVPSQPVLSQSRNEMKGPKTMDIDNILSGLKIKTPEQSSQTAKNSLDNIEEIDMNMSYTNNNNISEINDDSMISISSLKEINNNHVPRKPRRRNRSDKNTISLDI